MTNHITLTGNVTRDPELRFTTTGQARIVVAIATNRRFQAKGAAEPTEITSFFSVVAWGSLAEHAAESLKKGDRVTVTGRVDQRSWIDDNGQPHSSFEVVADELALSLRFRSAEVDRARRESAPTRMNDGGVQAELVVGAHSEVSVGSMAERVDLPEVEGPETEEFERELTNA
jgi:single-strand DNA-binding protein